MNLYKLKYIISLVVINSVLLPLYGQNIDTIANWDGINVNWTVIAPSGQLVENPEQQGINTSGHCMELTTSDNPYDFIYTDFTTPLNFDEFPIYHMKILAPESGGSVLLKFENSDNTSWSEIEKTPAPGQWVDLEFDFSSTTATDYVRMVIFFDFQGTTISNTWYIDDIIRISDNTAGLTSNLPIVIINTNGVEIPDEPKIAGTMGIIDNGPGNINNQYDPPNDYNGHIGIEIRGQSSQMFPKKSYGFETRDEQGNNLNVPLLGMPEENDWILYAPYSDKSMLRNFISFFMGSKLDPYCSRIAFCEVIVNNEYMGVYILMEKIKKDDNRVSIATLNPEDISGDELTGGYIVKVDKIDPDFVYGDDGWKSYPSPPYPNAMNITFQYYYPKANDIVQQQRSYIQDYIYATESSLTGSNFDDPNNGYNKYLNTGSFIDQMILAEIAKEVDNYRYSTYFYKEKDSDGGKLFAGPAWDFNLGYSNVDYWAPGLEYQGWQYTMVEPNEWSIMFWWKRLMEDAYYRNLLKTRWYQLRENELSNVNLGIAIDSIVNYIDEAQQRNYERWPILGTYVWPNYDWEGNVYNDEVEFFENWFYNRLNWMDNNVPGTWLLPAAELTGYFPQMTVTLFDDYFNRQVLKKKYFELNNAPPDLVIDTVIFLNASEATIMLSGYLIDPVDVSVTLDSKILNSFEDLTTSLLTVGIDDNRMIEDDFKVYAKQNTIVVNCSQPKLLGERIEVFNLTGKRVKIAKLNESRLNEITINLNPGIYFCRFSMNGKPITKSISIMK